MTKCPYCGLTLQKWDLCHNPDDCKFYEEEFNDDYEYGEDE